MNRKRFTTALIAAMMVGVFGLGAVACKKKPVATETTPSSSEQITTTTTTIPTTTLTEFVGLLPNTIEITWTETQLEQPLTFYAKVSKGEFLNVREGPGTNYKKVGTLTRGQTVEVVARCTGDWYKTNDGYYVYGEYLSDKVPN